MYKQFLKWIEEKKTELDSIGVTTEDIKVTNDDLPNPSTTVDHCSKDCLGRVTVWETGLMDIEVVHFETEERLLYEHFKIQNAADFGNLLERYVRVLTSGNKI